jgi:hypothetical protein
MNDARTFSVSLFVAFGGFIGQAFFFNFCAKSLPATAVPCACGFEVSYGRGDKTMIHSPHNYKTSEQSILNS